MLIVENKLYDEVESLPERVRIFDTTLRDGEQTAGISFTKEQKLMIARQLAKLGVASIEAGFPASSPGELEAVKAIANEGLGVEIVGLARSNKRDIDKALDANVDAIHVFIAASDIHLKYKLRMTREEALRAAIEAVEYAKEHGVVVEFSPEDATRADLKYLYTMVESVVDAGADRVDIPDTVGVMTPTRMKYLIRYILPAAKGRIVSVHCHNDFGLAVANSISGIEAGAQQAHVTVNGIGERAGNAALEEVVAALEFLLNVRTGVKTELLYETSLLVSKLSGIPIPPNKPIVGANAFAHESGIHVHGVINNPFTYEPIRPEMVGQKRRIVLGKHSGRHGVEHALKTLGYPTHPDLVLVVLKKVKEYGDKGMRVTEEEFRKIVEESLRELEEKEARAEEIKKNV
ncbi:2-isopropylmalate synthase [Ignicoccus islandicus DSM 13165]|uniref:2-isopropylmalate synthase n=1 Tax=Ignicoccus islandicus DSM 13165 TaxID=940295 RepID=A0A0U2M9Z8_9CREN|nr:isopropylmalate synthase [Ignicoccus islandicus]ALU11933.1 2-isopropylmalate synthase [Ignicoccus islandicus DSM 13165]